MALTWFSLIRSRLARSPALAWLVAAVLPLGQAHCVLMGVQVASDRACASAQPAAVVHACCAVRTVPAPAHPATRPADPFAPRCCACLGIPPATTIAPVTLSRPHVETPLNSAQLDTDEQEIPSLERIAPARSPHPPHERFVEPQAPRGPPLA